MGAAGSRESLFPVLKNEIRAVRSALWFRPAAFCTLAALGAVILGTAGSWLPASLVTWLPEVAPGTVQELLKLLASGMLTVATVTLSVLMLVLSIAAGQASPRTVPEVMADPVTQNALGTFLATFVYALTALLLFGVEVVEGSGVTLAYLGALLITLNAVRYLVQWIHHVAESLKVNSIVHRVHRQAQAVLKTHLVRVEGEEERQREAPSRSRAGEPKLLHTQSTGYVQLIDAAQFEEVARERELLIELSVQEGDFVHSRTPLAQLWGDEADKEDVREALSAAVVVGFERSHEGDPRLGFELLAEVACRALSPGINDPQTALVCLNYSVSLLAQAGATAAQDYPASTSPDGRVHFRRADFAAMLERALRPVVRDGAASAEVICAVTRSLLDLARCVAPDHLEELLAEAQRAEDYGTACLRLEADRKVLCDLTAELREVAAQRRS